jgi:hypothetical protein
MPLFAVSRSLHPVKELPLVNPGADAGSRAADALGRGLQVGSYYRPRRVRDVLALDMGDGYILYDPGGSLVHHLNPSAGIVWHLADGSATVEQLAEDIAVELGVDGKEVRQQVTSLIAELDALGVLEDARAGAAGARPPGGMGT